MSSYVLSIWDNGAEKQSTFFKSREVFSGLDSTRFVLPSSPAPHLSHMLLCTQVWLIPSMAFLGWSGGIPLLPFSPTGKLVGLSTIYFDYINTNKTLADRETFYFIRILTFPPYTLLAACLEAISYSRQWIIAGCFSRAWSTWNMWILPKSFSTVSYIERGFSKTSEFTLWQEDLV